MRALVLLSTVLAVTYAAPQFVFFLPQGFQDLLKPGATANFKPIKVEHPPTSTSEVPLAVETPVEIEPVVEEVLIPEVEAVPSVSEAEAALLIPEVEAAPTIPEAEAAPTIPEAVPIIPEAEVAPLIPETEAAPSIPEAEADHSISTDAATPAQPSDTIATITEADVEVMPISDVSPLMEASVTPSEIIVENIPPEEFITVQESKPVDQVDAFPIADAVKETVVAVDAVPLAKSLTSATPTEIMAPMNVIAEVVPARAPAFASGPLQVVFSPFHSKIIPAPILNLVDPLAHVDPRFRRFIYPNDSPEVVAAKVELFRVHAALNPLPKPTVIV